MLPSMPAATAGQGLRNDQADGKSTEKGGQLPSFIRILLDPSGVRGLKKTEMQNKVFHTYLHLFFICSTSAANRIIVETSLASNQSGIKQFSPD